MEASYLSCLMIKSISMILQIFLKVKVVKMLCIWMVLFLEFMIPKMDGDFGDIRGASSSVYKV
jgi:hypothetical protein